MEQVNSMLNQFRAGLDAPELIQIFREEYGNNEGLNTELELSEFEGNCYVPDSFDRDIIQPLLTDTSCGALFILFPHPLFIALDTESICLVELFLLAGVPARDIVTNCTNAVNFIRSRITLFDLAIEFACHVGRPDVVMLLVSYYKSQISRAHVMQWTDDGTSPFIKSATPLHTVMFLAVKHFLGTGEVQYSLPAYVQLISESGDFINVVDDEGLTPLLSILDLVRVMFVETELEVALAFKGHREAIDTVRTLLDVGSRFGGRSNVVGSIKYILQSIKDFTDPVVICCYEWQISLHYTFVVELLELLLEHEAVTAQHFRCFTTIFRAVAKSYVFLHHQVTNIANDISYDDNIIYTNNFCPSLFGLGNVFRTLLRAGPSHDVTRVYWEACINSVHFVDAFITIAGYSRVPGRSNTLVQLMLSALSATQVNELKLVISARLEFTTALIHDPDRNTRATTTSALEWVGEIQTPFCLQHLARRAINVALSGRFIPDADALGVPVHILQYLRYQESGYD